MFIGSEASAGGLSRLHHESLIERVPFALHVARGRGAVVADIVADEPPCISELHVGLQSVVVIDVNLGDLRPATGSAFRRPGRAACAARRSPRLSPPRAGPADADYAGWARASGLEALLAGCRASPPPPDAAPPRACRRSPLVRPVLSSIATRIKGSGTPAVLRRRWEFTVLRPAARRWRFARRAGARQHERTGTRQRAVVVGRRRTSCPERARRVPAATCPPCPPMGRAAASA